MASNQQKNQQQQQQLQQKTRNSIWRKIEGEKFTRREKNDSDLYVNVNRFQLDTSDAISFTSFCVCSHISEADGYNNYHNL